MLTKSYKPLGKSENLVVREIHDGILVYDLTTDKVFHLNSSSAAVWRICNGKLNLNEMIETLKQSSNFNVTEDLIAFALEQLRGDGLLQGAETMTFAPPSVRRRDIIRRIAITTLAALPVVTALVAPNAVSAQSVTCSTGAPGGLLCRCSLSDTPNVGDNCGTKFAVGDVCNPGCTCRRTAVTCSTSGGTAGTCQGNCV